MINRAREHENIRLIYGRGIRAVTEYRNVPDMSWSNAPTHTRVAGRGTSCGGLPSRDKDPPALPLTRRYKIVSKYSLDNQRSGDTHPSLSKCYLISLPATLSVAVHYTGLFGFSRARPAKYLLTKAGRSTAQGLAPCFRKITVR